MKFSKYILQTGTVLDKIMSYKVEELEEIKKKINFDDIKRKAEESNFSIRNFYKAISKTNSKGINLIAEIKKASPSKGIIKKDFDAVEIAKEYDKSGADTISILTDNHFFQGELSYLSLVKKATNIPILRKDFIFDPYQVYEARANGADAILLISTVLEKSVLQDLRDLALSLNLDCLIETHNAEEIEKTLEINPKIIGINARDLNTFEEDLDLVVRLSSMIPKEITKVSESAINNRNDVVKVQNAGISAILVGTSLIKADSIQEKIGRLLTAPTDDTKD